MRTSDGPRAAQGGGQWLGRIARPRGPLAVTALALPLASGVLLVVQCWLIAHVLHGAIIEGVDPGQLTVPVVLLAVVIGVRALLGIAAEASAVAAGEDVKRRVREALVGDLVARRPTWIAAQASGALAGLTAEQVEALDGYLVRYLPAMVQAALLPLAFAVVVFPIDWIVGLIFVFTAPLIPVFMALAGWGAEAASRAQADSLARLTAYFADRLRGLVTLRLFGRAEIEIAGVRRATDELRARTMRVMRVAFLSSAVLEFFAALGVAGVALYVGLTFLDLLSLRSEALTLQAGLFCLLLAPEVYQPLRLLAAHYHDRASARAAVAEIEARLGGVPDDELRVVADEPATKSETPHHPVTVSLRDVAVATPLGRAVVAGVDLEIAPGSRHAILGASGCGKSTLIEAIAGLREHEGEIRLDDIALRDLDAQTLRQRVAMLSQRPHVFAGTIADNIRLARPDACPTSVHRAARRAVVTAFADELPAGLDTVIGENGLGLSGGEIHRVALARLYLRDPDLVIADEPTAHLDAVTEALVLDGIIDFCRGRTLVVVTHSEAVAARMDRAWRLVDGRLLPAPVRRTRNQLRGAA